jgi:hypothetical protein
MATKGKSNAVKVIIPVVTMVGAVVVGIMLTKWIEKKMAEKKASV